MELGKIVTKWNQQLRTRTLCTYTVCSTKRKYRCFLHGEARNSRLDKFWTWATSVTWKSWNKIQDIFCFENAIYRKLHKRSNIVLLFFSRAPKKKKFFPEKIIWNVSSEWQMKISDIESRHIIYWKCYTQGCFTKEATSLHLSRST